MTSPRTTYDRTQHAAARTSEFLFHQLIPYIGNKRKLLRLIEQAAEQTAIQPGARFVDFFAGSGVVARWAKLMGYRVIANDWEPYAQAINRCYIACNRPPSLASLGGYQRTVERLNGLTPTVGWITDHLCPRDDIDFGYLPIHHATAIDADPADVISGKASLGPPTLVPRLFRRTPDLRWEGIIHESVPYSWFVDRADRGLLVHADIIHLGGIQSVRDERGVGAWLPS